MPVGTDLDFLTSEAIAGGGIQAQKRAIHHEDAVRRVHVVNADNAEFWLPQLKL